MILNPKKKLQIHQSVRRMGAFQERGQLKIGFFYYKAKKPASLWYKKIKTWITKKYPEIVFDNKKPDVVITLGGDGTILDAARRYHHISNPLILGLNLGRVGFLASIRDEKNFLTGLGSFFKEKYKVGERMAMQARVMRAGTVVFQTEAFNDLAVQNLFGLVDIDVHIDGNPIKSVRGSGFLVSTASGSTAYNLSAHGPIVMPEMKCMILTEIMDHDIPSPSIVVNEDKEVCIKVKSFRERKAVRLVKSGEKVDVLLFADGFSFFPLQEKDEVCIKSSSHLVRFVEFEENYFFKSLKEKFSFK